MEKIYGPVEDDLVKVEENLNSISHVDFSWLSGMLGYTIKGGGKRIRPALTLLSGKFYDYDLERLLLMAASVELLHTATLVHDDAIDKSSVRRGRPTFNNIYGDEKAILLGDYLFAKAGEFSASTENIRVVKLFSQTLMIISKGELNQAINAYNMEQAFDSYLYRITAKTASLFMLATESGAVLSKAPETCVQALKDYALNLGIAFQIVDDILDYIGSEKELGKPVGSDLLQGTFTLPAMLLVKKYPQDNPIKRTFQDKTLEQKREDIQKAIGIIRDSNIVQECYKQAADYSEKAVECLKILPNNPAREVLTNLARYVVNRKN
ncbi:polyprenyl synthetase family protein [Chloroflexota bacterium]